MPPTITPFRPHRWTKCAPGFKADLAAEDRDLLAEAQDEDGCITTAMEVVLDLYPIIHLGEGARVHPMHN